MTIRERMLLEYSDARTGEAPARAISTGPEMFQLQRMMVAAKTPMAWPDVILDQPSAPTTREMMGSSRNGRASASSGSRVKPASRSNTGFMRWWVLLLEGLTR